MAAATARIRPHFTDSCIFDRHYFREKKGGKKQNILRVSLALALSIHNKLYCGFAKGNVSPGDFSLSLSLYLKRVYL
jgi:hypothetical protein